MYLKREIVDITFQPVVIQCAQWACHITVVKLMSQSLGRLPAWQSRSWTFGLKIFLHFQLRQQELVLTTGMPLLWVSSIFQGQESSLSNKLVDLRTSFSIRENSNRWEYTKDADVVVWIQSIALAPPLAIYPWVRFLLNPSSPQSQKENQNQSLAESLKRTSDVAHWNSTWQHFDANVIWFLWCAPVIVWWCDCVTVWHFHLLHQYHKKVLEFWASNSF